MIEHHPVPIVLDRDALCHGNYIYPLSLINFMTYNGRLATRKKRSLCCFAFERNKQHNWVLLMPAELEGPKPSQRCHKFQLAKNGVLRYSRIYLEKSRSSMMKSSVTSRSERPMTRSINLCEKSICGRYRLGI